MKSAFRGRDRGKFCSTFPARSRDVGLAAFFRSVGEVASRRVVARLQIICKSRRLIAPARRNRVPRVCLRRRRWNPFPNARVASLDRLRNAIRGISRKRFLAKRSPETVRFSEDAATRRRSVVAARSRARASLFLGTRRKPAVTDFRRKIP